MSTSASIVLAAEPEAGDRDEHGDADRRQSVGMGEAEPRRRQTDQNEKGRNEIARIVQGVGGQRVALGLSRDLRQGRASERNRRRSRR